MLKYHVPHRAIHCVCEKSQNWPDFNQFSTDIAITNQSKSLFSQDVRVEVHLVKIIIDINAFEIRRHRQGFLS